MLPPPRPIAPLLTAVCALILSGCQTYTSQTKNRDNAMRTGDIASAVTKADKDAAANKDNRNTILYRLEQGALLRDAALANIPLTPADPTLPASQGKTQTNQALNAASSPLPPRISYLTRSIAAFDEAARRIDDAEAAARIQLGSEAGALMTNQANTNYNGRAYDKVMLHTYQALNYLQLDDSDAARVELNRALQRQRDAVAANAKRIDQAQRLATEARSNGVKDETGRQGTAYDVDRAQADPRTAAELSPIEAKLNATILPYGDYINPFTTFLDALIFTHQGSDASDLERARKSWERVLNFAPQNPYVREDYIAVEPDLASATATLPATSTTPPANGVTYILFETGSAPYREQIRIDIPLFLVTSKISYVGAAFPRIELVDAYATPLVTTTTTGASYTTALVASMDSIIAQDFKNEWPTILTKTLISTATKAAIDAVLQKQIDDNSGKTAGFLYKIASAGVQAAVNVADTRSWRTLPKQFHYARLPTPTDHRLTFTTAGQTTSLSLEPAAVNVVYVKSHGTTSPLLASQFILKK
jgi:uncharacterized protein